MKRVLNHIIAGACSSILFVSCFADLDQMPLTPLPETYFVDSTSCAAALVGVYDGMQQNYLYSGDPNSIHVLWNMTDEIFAKASVTGPRIYNYTSAFAVNATIYRGAYEAIQRCNQFLYYLSGVSMNTDTRNMFEGETRFIRALLYFTLVQNWGRVPLITEATTSVNNPYYPQTDEASIYDWIIGELQDIENMVKPIEFFGFGGRVSQSAVQALAARVCLFKAGFPCYDKSKYAEAYDWAYKVIVSGKHDLTPNFADAFISLVQDRYLTEENIFEVEAYMHDKSATIKEYMPSLSVTMGTNVSAEISGVCMQVSNTYYAHMKMTKLFTTDNDSDFGSIMGCADERRNWSIAPYTYSATTTANVEATNRLVMNYIDIDPTGIDASNNDLVKYYSRQSNKFNRSYTPLAYYPGLQSNTGTNFVVLRYSDVLLMAAEAIANMDSRSWPDAEAIGYVNKVRERAFGKKDNRYLVDAATVTAAGSGYIQDKTVVEVNYDDGTKTICYTTATAGSADAGTLRPRVYAYNVGFVQGAPTIIIPVVNEAGEIADLRVMDRGHALHTAPTLTIRKMSNATSGEGSTGAGASGIVTLKTTQADHELPASAISSKATFMQTIMDERARELCFEGWRRLDLKRWHTLLEALGEVKEEGANATGLNQDLRTYIALPSTNATEAHYYLPIPSSEIMLNRMLEQNEGW